MVKNGTMWKDEMRKSWRNIQRYWIMTGWSWKWILNNRNSRVDPHYSRRNESTEKMDIDIYVFEMIVSLRVLMWISTQISYLVKELCYRMPLEVFKDSSKWKIYERPIYRRLWPGNVRPAIGQAPWRGKDLQLGRHVDHRISWWSKNCQNRHWDMRKDLTCLKSLPRLVRRVIGHWHRHWRGYNSVS